MRVSRALSPRSAYARPSGAEGVDTAKILPWDAQGAVSEVVTRILAQMADA